MFLPASILTEAWKKLNQILFNFGLPDYLCNKNILSYEGKNWASQIQCLYVTYVYKLALNSM